MMTRSINANSTSSLTHHGPLLQLPSPPVVLPDISSALKCCLTFTVVASNVCAQWRIRDGGAQVVAITFSPWTLRIVLHVHAKHIEAINSPGRHFVYADTLQFTALHVCRPLSNGPLKMPCMPALVWAPHVLLFLSDHYTLAPVLTAMTF